MSDTENTGEGNGGENSAPVSGGESADGQSGGESSTPAGGGTDLKQTGHIIYALYAVNFIVPFAVVAGVIFCYLKREDAAGTFLQSHIEYMIRTFWITLIASLIALVLTILLIGIVVFVAVAIWYIYRIVKGWISLNDEKPIADPMGFL